MIEAVLLGHDDEEVLYVAVERWRPYIVQAVAPPMRTCDAWDMAPALVTQRFDFDRVETELASMTRSTPLLVYRLASA